METLGTVLQNLAQRLLNIQQDASKPAKYFEPACALCDDLGWQHTKQGVRPCECQRRKQVARRVETLNRRYSKFAGFDLMALRPRNEYHAKQSALLNAVQTNPAMSLLMFGGTGTGKTLIGYCLAKYAAEQGRPVVAITLAELLEQYRAQTCGADKLPVIDAETLRDAHGRYLIFIDEIDKARPTEFAGEKFFQLANAIYETGQQVVIASNLPKPQLMAHWERAGQSDFHAEHSQYGAPIMRRLCEVEDSAEVELF